MKSETRNCQNCKNDFAIEEEDFNFYKKMEVPPPTFCPLCRAQRRMAFRNERKLFKVKDAFTGEEIFSTFPTESGRKIIKRETWFGDTWDALEYGQEYDFSKPFFTQFHDLIKRIPIYNLNVIRMVNSPYAFNATGLKNCYLICNSNDSENCMYGNAVDVSKDCVDNSHVKQSERCYESFWLDKDYHCYFTIRSMESSNLWFCRGCVGCNDCFGSVNLRNTSYCIFNKQYTKEEYEKKIKEMNLHTYSGLMKAREQARKFWYTQPAKFHQGLKNLNCTGSYVTNSKNVKDCYCVRESENMRYCQYLQVPSNKENYDVSNWGNNTELNYETIECGSNSYNNKFSWNCWPACRNNEYSAHLFSSSDCFGCSGLKKKQYCILNKQYTQKEYYERISKIKKQMDQMPYVDSQGLIYKYGEFLPLEFSSLGYNNTVAIQHFPLTKEEAQAKGYSWVEVGKGEYIITKKATDLPDSIFDCSNEILKEIIECEGCKNPYRILEDELIFYKNEQLPLPRICSECRHERRISDRLTLHLYERKCMCGGETDETGIYKNTVAHAHGGTSCGETFSTGYAPTHPEIVYCEKCYQQEVY